MLETDAVYDENGNLLEVKEVYSDNGEVSFELSYKYDKNNNVVYSYENSGYFIDEDTLEYDSKGKVIKDTFTTSSGAEGYFEYTYDSKGRKTKSVYYYYSGPDMTFNDTTTYTYNKKGYLTKSISESKSGSKTVNTYKYNSDGNMYYYSSDDYDENGFVDRYEYKYEFDEYGVMLVGYIKYPDSDEWYDMSELGD